MGHYVDCGFALASISKALASIYALAGFALASNYALAGFALASISKLP
jgi:hypothetical protein